MAITHVMQLKVGQGFFPPDTLIVDNPLVMGGFVVIRVPATISMEPQGGPMVMGGFEVNGTPATMYMDPVGTPMVMGGFEVSGVPVV